MRAERRGEYELADRAREAGKRHYQRHLKLEWRDVLPSKECIERKIGDKNAVKELRDAREHDEDQERVNELESRGRLHVVRAPE